MGTMDPPTDLNISRVVCNIMTGHAGDGTSEQRPGRVDGTSSHHNCTKYRPNTFSLRLDC